MEESSARRETRTTLASSVRIVTGFVLLVLALVIGGSSVVQLGNAAGCASTCYFTGDTTVSASEGTVWVRLDGVSYFTLPHTFAFGNGTTHTVEAMNLTLYSGSTGARYVWKQWALNGVQWTPTAMMTTPVMEANYTNPTDLCFGGTPCVNPQGAFTAQFEKQYQFTLGFTDPSGQPISSPASVILRSGGTTVTASSYNSQWYTAGSWTVTDAAWEMPLGAGMIVGTPTFDLSNGPVTGTVQLKAFPAKLRVTDRLDHPLFGATATVMMSNGTSVILTTDTQGYADLGHIPLGVYTVAVRYQGVDMGSWSVDASTTPQFLIVLSGVPPPDIYPPTWPSTSTLNVSNVTDTSLTLWWSTATDDSGVASYRVYEGTMLIATVPGNVHFYTVGGLSPTKTYTFTVKAEDAAGNQSVLGLSKTQTIPVSLQQFWFVVLVSMFSGAGFGELAAKLTRRRH